MSDVPFAEPARLFDTVDALRGSFASAESADGLRCVSVPNLSGQSESVTTAAALAAGLLDSFVPQLELLARSISLGTLDVIAADSVDGDE